MAEITINEKLAKLLVKTGSNTATLFYPETLASQVSYTRGEGDTAVTTNVQSAIAALEQKFVSADAIVFKGTVANKAALPTADVKAGWTYKASADFPATDLINGKHVEAGDVIICTAESPLAWDVIQANVDGAVTATAVAEGEDRTGKLAVFANANGTTVSAGELSVSDALRDHYVSTGDDFISVAADAADATGGGVKQVVTLDTAALYDDLFTNGLVVATDSEDILEITKGENGYELGLTSDAIDELNEPAVRTVTVGGTSFVASSDAETLTVSGAGAVAASITAAGVLTVSAPTLAEGDGITLTAADDGTSITVANTGVESVSSSTTLGSVSVKKFGADAADVVVISQMTGAEGANAGTAGYVPAPVSGSVNKFLAGDATWKAAVTAVTVDETKNDDGTYKNPGTITVTLDGVSSTIALKGLGTTTELTEHAGLKATSDVLGHVMIGDGIDVADGVISHPSYDEAAMGLYKVSVDSFGHVDSTVAVTVTDLIGDDGVIPAAAAVKGTGEKPTYAGTVDGYMTKEQAADLANALDRITALEATEEAEVDFKFVNADTGSVVAETADDEFGIKGTDTKVVTSVKDSDVIITRTLDAIAEDATVDGTTLTTGSTSEFADLRNGGLFFALSAM